MTPMLLLPVGAHRVNHGLHNPRGLRVRVAAGAGAGCKIPTREKPSPAGKGSRAGAGCSFSLRTPPSRFHLVIFRHQSSLFVTKDLLHHFRHPRSHKSPLHTSRCKSPCFFCGSTAILAHPIPGVRANKYTRCDTFVDCNISLIKMLT